jgi:hypothetical protein
MTRQRLEAACLVLFPLVFLVAASAGAWQAVHLVLAAGSLLAMGAVLALRRLVSIAVRMERSVRHG